MTQQQQQKPTFLPRLSFMIHWKFIYMFRSFFELQIHANLFDVSWYGTISIEQQQKRKIRITELYLNKNSLCVCVCDKSVSNDKNNQHGKSNPFSNNNI